MSLLRNTSSSDGYTEEDALRSSLHLTNILNLNSELVPYTFDSSKNPLLYTTIYTINKVYCNQTYMVRSSDTDDGIQNIR